MFARVITFEGTPDSVDGAIRFPIKKIAESLKDVPGFLGMFDLANRKTGRAVVISVWATKEACSASADLARDNSAWVAKEADENVMSIDEYEVGHHTFTFTGGPIPS
jgi:heme-degrading monooxygenase HmoA